MQAVQAVDMADVIRRAESLRRLVYLKAAVKRISRLEAADRAARLVREATPETREFLEADCTRFLDRSRRGVGFWDTARRLAGKDDSYEAWIASCYE